MAKPITVHTIESLKEKTIEVGDCWIWQGYKANGSPQVYWQGKIKTVRRVIKEILTGKPAVKHLYIASNCGDPNCVNPDHFVYRTHKQHMSYMAHSVNQDDIGRRLKLREAARQRGLIKVTDEQIQEILVSDLSGAELGRRLNVSRGLVGLIRRGRNRSISNQINNPFAGLFQ